MGLKGFLGLCLIFLLTARPGLAFDQNTLAQSDALQTQKLEIKRNTARILFSTLGGAVLGLSTLSFYGEPQEHTNNITMGALIGLIAGSGYVLYSNTPKNPERDTTFQNYGLLSLNKKEALAIAKAPLMLNYQFEF